MYAALYQDRKTMYTSIRKSQKQYTDLSELKKKKTHNIYICQKKNNNNKKQNKYTHLSEKKMPTSLYQDFKKMYASLTKRRYKNL